MRDAVKAINELYKDLEFYSKERKRANRDLGEQLRKHRLSKGIKLTYVADQIGVSPAAVSAYEKGWSVIKKEVIDIYLKL